MEITITIKYDDKDLEGLKKTEESKPETRHEYSRYARVIDELCLCWSKNRKEMLKFLKSLEVYATAKLKAHGYLFLNDVYDMLGLARSKEGQVVGWIYDENNPVGDNYVDFDLEESYARGLFNDDSTEAIVIDFNIDGVIWDKI